MTDDELVARVVSWARRKRRRLERDVLESVLRVRDDGATPVGLWPSGSVIDLLLVRWPATGEQLPERESLRATLDTFWRFLRASGRMAHASADPRALRIEFGQTALLAWLPEVPELPLPPHLRQQEDLEREMAVKNAEANGKRYWEEGDRPRTAFSGRSSGSTDEAWYKRASPSRSSPVVRGSRFVQECLQLADWVGTGVDEAEDGMVLVPVCEEVPEDLVVDLALMWAACEGAGLIEVEDGVAVASASRPCSDQDWADLGLELVIHLLIAMDELQRGPVLYAAAGLIDPGSGGLVPDVLVGWWWTAPGNPVGPRSASPDPRASEKAMRAGLKLMRSLGLLESLDDGRGLVPTPLGHDVGRSVLYVGMQGAFLDDEARARLAG